MDCIPHINMHAARHRINAVSIAAVIALVSLAPTVRGQSVDQIDRYRMQNDQAQKSFETESENRRAAKDQNAEVFRDLQLRVCKPGVDAEKLLADRPNALTPKAEQFLEEQKRLQKQLRTVAENIKRRADGMYEVFNSSCSSNMSATMLVSCTKLARVAASQGTLAVEAQHGVDNERLIVGHTLNAFVCTAYV